MLNNEDAILVVIDVQERFLKIIHEHEQLVPKLEKTIKVAEIFELPVLWTEQAPDKLGPTVSSIHHLLFPIFKPIAKHSFSAWGCAEFVSALQALNRKQIILVGIETQVCIYQTASDLHKHGFEVHVVADVTSSRTLQNKEIALARLRQEGVTITVIESVICELLKTAHHPKFRDVMAYVK